MGNKLKHEIKAHTLFELGEKLDDQLEAAQREQCGFDGAKNALTAAKAMVEGLSSNVDRDIKEGALDLDQSVLIKRWIARCAAVVQNLGLQAEVQNYQAQGKVMALRHSVKLTKALYDTEKAGLEEATKAEQGLAEELDPRRPDARATGQHPGNPLADRREEEDGESPPEPTLSNEEVPPVASVSGESTSDGEVPSEPPPPKKSTSKPPKKKTRSW